MTCNRAEIPANLFPPDREDCLRAVSLALLKVRSDLGLTREKLAKVLDCGVDAISDGTNEKHLLSFDSIALLCHHFPDESAPILSILLASAPRHPSPGERLERIEREVAALRREVEA